MCICVDPYKFGVVTLETYAYSSFTAYRYGFLKRELAHALTAEVSNANLAWNVFNSKLQHSRAGGTIYDR